MRPIISLPGLPAIFTHPLLVLTTPAAPLLLRMYLAYDGWGGWGGVGIRWGVEERGWAQGARALCMYCITYHITSACTASVQLVGDGEVGRGDWRMGEVSVIGLRRGSEGMRRHTDLPP